MLRKNLYIIMFLFLFVSTGIFIYSVRAGTLEFDGVPVDITTSTGEDLIIVPGTGGNTQIGDATGTNTNATSNDDLHVTGSVESDGAIYADSGITCGGDIIPDTDSADSLGSSSKAWQNIYADTIATTIATDLSLSPALGSGVDYTITRSAATEDETAVDITATINKATSGNYTGIKLNVTETSAPGTSDKLLDLQVGGTPYFQIFNSAASTNYGLLSVGSDDWDGSTDGYFDGNANGTLIAGNAASGYEGNLMDLQVGGTSLFNVDSDGNVTAAGTFAGGGILGGSGTAGYLSKWSAATTLDDSVIYDDGTNVGIGTTAPTDKLEVGANSGSNAVSINTGTAGTGSIFFNDGADDGAMQYSHVNRELSFNVAGSSKVMLIDADGNVGIGTTAPESLLTVSGGDYGGTPHEYTNLLVEGDDYAMLTIGTPTNGVGYIRFADPDANTIGGIEYDHNVNDMYLRTAGATLITLESDSQVGIGNVSPANKLEVTIGEDVSDGILVSDPDDDIAFLGDLGSSAEKGVVRLYATGVENARITSDPVANSWVMGNLGIGTTGPTGKLQVNGSTANWYVEDTGVRQVFTRAGVSWIRANNASGELAFETGGSTERIRIDSNGNVGIGITGPSYPLDINGGIALLGCDHYNLKTRTDNTQKTGHLVVPHFDTDEENIIIFRGAGNNGANVISFGGGSSAFNSATQIDFITAANSTTTTGTVAMTIDSSQYVGIGTTAPSTALEVNGTITATAFSTDVGTVDGHSLDADDGDPTDALYVDSAGRVGIGTTSPSSPLEIQNSVAELRLIDTDAGNAFALKNNGGNLEIIEATDPRLYIKAGGNVGIGTTDPASKLNVVGAVQISGNGSYGLGMNTTPYGAGQITFGSPYNLATGTDVYTIYQSSNQFYFRPGAGVMVVTNTSSTGIGDETPDAMLEVSASGGATDLLCLSSNDGTDGDRFIVKNDGSVGIGTTAPNAILEINGGAGSTTGLDIRNLGTATCGIDFTNSGLSGNDDLICLDASYKVQADGDVAFRDGSFRDCNISNQFLHTGNTATKIAFDTDIIDFQAGGKQVRFDGTGADLLVGIGTTAPAHALDVAGAIYSRRNALTDGATIAVDWNDGNVQSVTLGGDRAITFSNGQDGGKYTLIIKQDASGSRTITSWDSAVRWADGTEVTLTTTANKTDYLGFIYNGVDSKYDCVSQRLNF